MSIYIVDTNIVFSAILNPESNIGDLLLNSDDCLKFYSPAYLRLEIDKYREKILALSGYQESDFNEIKQIIFSRIEFINEEIIPFDIWRESARVLRNIDSDDVAFLAASKFLDQKIWTGDQRLLKGLQSMGYDKVITTKELFQIRIEARKIN